MSLECHRGVIESHREVHGQIEGANGQSKESHRNVIEKSLEKRWKVNRKPTERDHTIVWYRMITGLIVWSYDLMII